MLQWSFDSFTNTAAKPHTRPWSRPDNLVLALKKALFLLLSTHLVLRKNRIFSSTIWENQHYFETLSAVTVKICTSFNHCSKFECWKRLRYLCSKYHVKFKVNTDHICKSRWKLYFGARRIARLANCAKRACAHARVCRSTTWWPSHRANVTFGAAINFSKCWKSIHFFQWNESEHVVWPNIIIWHSVCWISGALNEHYLKFWALNRALNAEKMRDAQSNKFKFYEHLVISALPWRPFYYIVAPL